MYRNIGIVVKKERKNLLGIFLVCLLVVMAVSTASAVRLTITAPDTVYAGEEFTVIVTHEGRPYQGASILIEDYPGAYYCWDWGVDRKGNLDLKNLTNRNGVLKISISEVGQREIYADGSMYEDIMYGRSTSGCSKPIIVNVLSTGSESDLTPKPKPKPTPSATACTSTVAPPKEEWSKTYGGSESERGYSVQQTADSGYILAGGVPHPTAQRGVGSWDFWLVKTDPNGNLEWEKTFEGTPGLAKSVQQTADGGYILAGAEGCLVKTDPNGNKEWGKTFGGGDAKSVQQTADGGYIFAGKILVKTDPNGNKEWEKTFERVDANSVQQTADGGYILAGAEGCFVKTDPNGNLEWKKTFGRGDAKSVQQTADGGYILAGNIVISDNGTTDGWLVKTDPNGNLEWEKILGAANDDDAKSVQQTTDGGYIFAGYTDPYGSRTGDGWLVKTDSNGNLEWEKTLGGSDLDLIFSLQQISDDGYIVAGYTYSYGDGSDAWLIKVEGESMPTPEEKGIPGFEVVFDIVGLLAVAFLIRRKNGKQKRGEKR